VNGLNNGTEIKLSKETIAEAISELMVSPTIRGEALTLEQFGRLSDIIYDKIHE
jgi:16S rRNA (adenine1518-N6/adenine1519-N6)-dimethyltransferase